MPVLQSCDARLCDVAPPALSHLAAGQAGVHDLRAGTSIVAVEGDLQLGFRDHSLAWLGDTVPLTSITLHEGEHFATPQRGVVSIHAAGAHGAVFVLQNSVTENPVHRVLHRAARHLGGLVDACLRRIA